MSDSSQTQNTSAYYGQASFCPNGNWTLQANTVTQLPRDFFISNSSSDDKSSMEIGNAIMQSDGTLRCPYDSTYLLTINMSLSDFADVTLPADQVPTMVFQFTYVPASSQSPSPSFVMGTVVLDKKNPYAQMAQRTVMATGDTIKILATSSLALTDVAVANQSQMYYNDDASNTLLQLYASVSGQPPSYNVSNKVSDMVTAPIINSKAVFTTTQDGQNGQSLFSMGMSFFTVSVQKLTPVTDSSQIIDGVTWDPIPSDLKSATAHFKTSSGPVNDNQYVAVARFDGW